MKIDKRRKYYLVLDTETTNSLEDPLVYDLGYAIIDKHGTIYKTESFIVSDIFFQDDLMASAYYIKKLSLYYKDIKVGSRKVVSLYEARQQLKEDMTTYSVQAVLAYNMAFDYLSTNTTERYTTKSKYRYFIPYGVPIWCIWNMACNTICNSKKYVEWCLLNGEVSQKGNIKTSAETVYKYLTDNPQFTESHTALEDVLIETAIFVECLKRKGITLIEKKINRACWQIPQRTRKKLTAFNELGMSQASA